MIRRTIPLLLAIAFVASCKRQAETPQPPPTADEAKEEKAAAAEETANDASVASVSGKSDPACIGPIWTGEPSTLTIGDRKYTRNGHELRIEGEAPEGAEVRIGVLANLNVANGENLFNVRRYLAEFEQAGVELIVVAGDSGDELDAIERNLRAVAEASVPVLAIAGNRERTRDFVAAVENVRKEKPNLLSGHEIRLLGLHGVDVVTLPGYHDPRYIHPEEGGCQYFLEDVKAVQTLASQAKNPVLLLAHGQPKGKTAQALDVIAPGGEHIGDSNLNEVILAAKIPFGIFANVKEAGGKALADLEGNRIVPQGEWSETLYLNPGAADSLEWTMNDGTPAHGMAAILHVKEGKASYRIYRAPKLTEAEREEAAKLAPAKVAAE